MYTHVKRLFSYSRYRYLPKTYITSKLKYTNLSRKCIYIYIYIGIYKFSWVDNNVMKRENVC